MEFPPELRYSPSHTWARLEADGTVTVGISDYAQYELGELQYLGLPRVGSSVAREASFGEAESVKTVSELHAPVAGEVLAVNDAAARDPAIVNGEPYAAGWLIKLAPRDPSELDALLPSDTYAAQVAASGH